MKKSLVKNSFFWVIPENPISSTRSVMTSVPNTIPIATTTTHTPSPKASTTKPSWLPTSEVMYPVATKIQDPIVHEPNIHTTSFITVRLKQINVF